MEVDSNFKITNYKISCSFKNFPSDFKTKLLNDRSTKQHGNFFVFRPRCFVYIIFPKARFVNITGIKHKSQFVEATKKFVDYFYLKSESPVIKIDNITACSRINNFCGLDTFEKVLLKNKQKILSIKFNSYIFPSIYLKLENKGTLIFFNSGKFNIVGLPCSETIESQIALLSAIIIPQS